MREPGGDIASMDAAMNEAKPAHLIYTAYVSLLREAESEVLVATAGSYHKRYANIETSLWEREAEAGVYADVTYTRFKHYGQIEVSQ